MGSRFMLRVVDGLIDDRTRVLVRVVVTLTQLLAVVAACSASVRCAGVVRSMNCQHGNLSRPASQALGRWLLSGLCCGELNGLRGDASP